MRPSPPASARHLSLTPLNEYTVLWTDTRKSERDPKTGEAPLRGCCIVDVVSLNGVVLLHSRLTLYVLSVWHMERAPPDPFCVQRAFSPAARATSAAPDSPQLEPGVRGKGLVQQVGTRFWFWLSLYNPWVPTFWFEVCPNYQSFLFCR